MDLEIQTQHEMLDPAWRDLVDHQARRLAERYPELLRLHVTLVHGAHHRHGAEEARLVANVEGTTLRAAKHGELVPDAIHAAFAALAIEIECHHVERRHVIRTPGARPQGSIGRVFRSAGYGFIRYQPGRDVYFKRRALHHLNFDTLEPGTPVEFEVEEGDKGLQAPRVFPAGDRGRA